MDIISFFKDFDLYNDVNTVGLLSFLLHNEKDGVVKTTTKIICDTTHLSISQVRTSLSKLIKKTIISKSNRNKIATITICKSIICNDSEKSNRNKIANDYPAISNTKEEKIERDSLPDKKEKEESNIKKNNKELPIFEKEENKENISVANATVSESNSDDQRTADEARDFYNSKIDENRSGMTKIKSRITGRRKAMLLSRIKEYGKESVGTVINEATKSSFLGGGGPKGWKADFEWIMRPNNFPKVLDGNYNNQNINYGAKGNIEQRMRDYAEVGAKFEKMADEDIWNREHGIKKEDDIPF
ncbi:MAG: hypothetical protein ACKOW2_06970 [Sphingobacteriaceae bacterium]